MGSIVNVGVLFYNNARLVNPFFFFLRKSTGIPLRVIAVDNGSSDGTGEELKKQMTKDDVIITVPKNVGCAKGGNLILNKMKEIEGSYKNILYLNSDIFISKRDSINRMHDMLELNPNVGIVYGESSAFNPTSSEFGVYTRTEYNFAFCMIRKETLEELGIFDPNLNVFYSDNDFQTRMSKSGKWKNMGCKEALAIHLQGETTYFVEGLEKRKKSIEHDKTYYEKKWHCKMPKVS